MRTCRMTLVVGGTLSGLFLGRVDADAKVVSYQINGQTYTYDTLDRQQVRDSTRAHQCCQNSRRGTSKSQCGGFGKSASSNPRVTGSD